MFPKMEMNWNRMPLGPGSKTKLKAIVRGVDRNIALRRLIVYRTLWQTSALLSVLLVGIVSTAAVFAQDGHQGSCQASNSLSVLIRDKNVTAYVPKGAWDWTVPNIGVVNIEGNSITPTQIATPNTVNACASNSETGQTICTANNTDVYVISGTTLKSTLTSGGSGMAMFLEGNCTNCGVTLDPIHNRAVIGLNISAQIAGFQILDLGSSPQFEKPIVSQAPNTDGSGGHQISGAILIDPIRNLILSPNEHSNYEIIKLPNKNKDDNEGEDNDKDDKTANGAPSFFENTFSQQPLSFGSAGEDCSTGIVLGSLMDPNSSDPSKLFIADLTRAKTIPGSPAGTWTAPSQIQTLSESHLTLGANGIGMAQGTHTGIVTGEFGFLDANGGNITAIAFKENDDADGKNGDKNDGPPAISDWVTCTIPGGFIEGFDPHTVTAYKSPKDGHAIGLVANQEPDPVRTVAVIDLTKLLDKNVVPRTTGPGLGHACASGTLSTTGRDAVVRFVPVQ
jgi:hypothetical protein